MPTTLDRIWIAIYLATIVILVVGGLLGLFAGLEFIRGLLIVIVSGIAIAHVLIVWRVPQAPTPVADDLRARYAVDAVDDDRLFPKNKDPKNKK